MNDMDEIMSEIHTHKKGVISFDEFCQIMKTPTMDTMRTMPSRKTSAISPSHYPLSTKRHSLAAEDNATTPTSKNRRHSLSTEAATTNSSSSSSTSSTASSSKQSSSTFSIKGLFSGQRRKSVARSKSPINNSPSKSNTATTSGDKLPLIHGSRKDPTMLLTVDDAPIQFSDQASAEDMRGVFDMFDLNKDGVLSVNEFKSVSSKLGIGVVMDDAEIRQLFNLVDTNKDGLISYDEFVRLFNIS